MANMYIYLLSGLPALWVQFNRSSSMGDEIRLGKLDKV